MKLSFQSRLYRYLSNTNIMPIIQKFFNSYITKAFHMYPSLVNQFQKIYKPNQLNSTFQTLSVIYYSDHILTLIKYKSNDKRCFVDGVIEIPIPGHIIGNNYVQNPKELAQITLDMLTILKIQDNPLLLILSTSLFHFITFPELISNSISSNDEYILSKSPYLPDDTLIDFLGASSGSRHKSLIRAVYTQKLSIDSWVETLQIINVPIIAITPAAPHIFDALSHNAKGQITVLIDIETNFTSVLIGAKDSTLDSTILPYGSAIYISDLIDDMCTRYFHRVLNSVTNELKSKAYEIPNNIYVTGQGLDQLVDKDKLLPTGFTRASDIQLVNYNYIPDNLRVHEIISKHVFSKINMTSIITSKSK